MLVEDVRKLNPIDQFCYWIKERYQIALRRKVGKPKPWTDDVVLRDFFFTHPYREMDKVTVWFRENVREPLRDSVDVVMATIVFRWFNYIPTGQLLWDYGKDQEGVADLLTQWNKKLVLNLLGRIRDSGGQVFTGAFMINSPAGKPKLEAICDRIEKVWQDRDRLLRDCQCWKTMQEAHERLMRYEGLGGFMAYEVVCDLRYTRWLERASDKLTWCNPGPGAIRGLYRVLGREFEKGNNASSPPKPKDWTEQTQKLLALVQRRLPKMPPFEMREIEMSLCEIDKYLRLLHGDGKAKRRYNGQAD